MIYKRQFLMICFSLVFLFLLTGCNKDENPVDSPLDNESEVLIKYIEANELYKTSSITAKQIWEGKLNNVKQIVLDIRAICEYTDPGHIEGAVHIRLSDIPAYYKANNLDKMDNVIITCLTGLNANYAASLLRLQGYKNVVGMVWGMSSWNAAFDYWTNALSDDRASQFETAPHEKNSEGNLPRLNVGKSSPEDILKARAEELMISGFNGVGISCETAFLGLDDYYIINYASMDSYLSGSGHIPKSVQYTPVQDFYLSTYLKTLPTDRPIVLYCGSSHGSAQTAAYLNMIGYNVKVIIFGNNAMNYSTINSGRKFTPEEIQDYPYVKGASKVCIE